MTINAHFGRSMLATVLTVGLIAGPIVAFAQSKAVSQRETAVAPEINPPGDIPDDQVFIAYKSPEGFSMKVPEGWARSDTAAGAIFADKYGQIDLATSAVKKAPTEASIKSGEVATLKADGHAVDVKTVRTLKLPAGDTVAVDYLSNSEVNPVTGRKIRLENRRLYFVHGGKEVALTLSAPAGADNVDQWKMMAESFRWTS